MSAGMRQVTFVPNRNEREYNYKVETFSTSDENKQKQLTYYAGPISKIHLKSLQISVKTTSTKVRLHFCKTVTKWGQKYTSKHDKSRCACFIRKFARPPRTGSLPLPQTSSGKRSKERTPWDQAGKNVLKIGQRGVMNGPSSFWSTCKMSLLLKMLAKFKCVLLCSCLHAKFCCLLVDRKTNFCQWSCSQRNTVFTCSQVPFNTPPAATDLN